jgi:cytoskeleton protein RodZ
MKPTVGQQLQRAREQAGISLDDAAHETHIRAHYLQNLEDDHSELLHSATQARGFLRLYAEFLGLSYPDLLKQWEAPEPEPPAKEQAGQAQPDAQDKKAFGWLKKLIPEKTEGKKPDQAETGTVSQPAEEERTVPQPGERQPEPPTEETQKLEAEAFEAPQIQDTQEIKEPLEQTGEEPEPDEQKEPQWVSALQSSDEEALPEGSSDEKAPADGKSFFLKVAGFLVAIGSKISNLLPSTKRNQDETEEQGAVQKNIPPQTSQDIFDQIGVALQARRKAMQLSLTDIENFTNLKRAFLVALESGRFDELPSTVQGRGMLNNYAQFLGMEESDLMNLFGQALQLQREERLRPQRKAEKPSVSVNVRLPERWRKIINPDLLIGSILIVGLFVFIIWGATQVFSHQGGGPTKAPSISEMLQATPSESAIPDLAQTEQAESTAAAMTDTPVPGVAVVQPTATIVATVNNAPLQLVIIAHDRAYLRITVDGKEAFAGRVIPDNVYTYSGNNIIHLLTGNAEALEVYFNQNYIGSLGDVGQVVNIDFTLNGLITPTPKATFTPTPTLPSAELQMTEAARTRNQ